METLEKYFELLKQGGADLAMRIQAQSVKTAPWTVYRCQYGCNRYGQSHCCPPKTPSWKETREMKSKVCNPDQCNFPGKTVPAMEACGIDVFATVRANGLEIHTLRDPGEVQNHFGLVMVE